MPSSPIPSLRAAPLMLVLGLVAFPAGLSAQGEKAKAPPARVEATRVELEAIAASPPKGMSGADLRAVQQRLANGDFAVGDRVLIQVQGDTTFSDTFPVRTGRMLTMPSLPPLSLEGVLRSEADSVITAFLGQYIREPSITVTPLIRLGVLGGVAKPGYYDVDSQSLLSEVVMNAGGGLGGTGDMGRSKVMRGNEEVLNPKAVNTAISNGSTLDILNLQSGDNFDVGVRDPQKTLSKVQILTALLAIPLMIVSIAAIGN